MSETKRLPLRNEVPRELTWDLTTIYANDLAFEEDYKTCERYISLINEMDKTINYDPKNLRRVLETVNTLERKLDKLYVYSSLKSDEDTSNNYYQSMNARCDNLVSNAGEAIAWVEPAILSLNYDYLIEIVKKDTILLPYIHYFEELFRHKNHILDAGHEAMLYSLDNIFNNSSNIYDVMTNSDLKFPVVHDNHGQVTELSGGIYSQLLESTNRIVRKEAFQKLYTIYHQFRNTLATTLSGEVKVNNYKARFRGYQSAKQAALLSNNIDVNVYKTLVQVVNKYLPLLHRYMKLRKKLLSLDELHMYDLYTPLFGNAPLSYDFSAAKKEALNALSVLGDNYKQHLEQEFNERWIDVVENKGKQSGAYSSGSYDTNPFILLNWQNNLENLFTLVHESGHSMHSYYTTHNQPFQYGNYPIFLAEIASTTNENILTEYLLSHYTDNNIRKYVLNHFLDGFKGTVFRQTQFAEFEDFVHHQEDIGNPLNADMLSNYYYTLNQKYYGSDVVSDPEIADEWARIPHFYMNYYVYQYATGFAASINLANNISSKNQDSIDKYLKYLKAGSSDYPLNIIKKAGVDMTTSDYLEKAFQVFSDRLTELENLI
jgi:oligoendopeptidase F